MVRVQRKTQLLLHGPEQWKYLSSAVTRSGKQIKIEPVFLTLSIARFWHQKIQPTIRTLSTAEYRADANWNWPHFLTLPMAAFAARRRCWGIALMVTSSSGQEVPVALAMICEPVEPIEMDAQRKHLKRHRRQSYVWFLSAAPPDALISLGVTDPPRAGVDVVDSTIVLSGKLGHDGRIWLHADPCDGYPEAGRKLLDFYLRACQLKPVGKRAPWVVVPLVRRKNDGRHFHADEHLARKLYTDKRR